VQDSSTLAQAIAAFERGDLAQARKLAEEQLAASPSPQADYLIGLIHCRQGDTAGGVEWLRQAVRAAPDNPAFRVMLARALVDSGRAAEALGTALPPTGAGPADLATWHVRAEAAERVGDFGKAVAAWRALCSARTTDWQACTNLGRNLLKLGRPDDADQAYREAMARAPAEARAIYRLYANDADAAGFEDRAFEAATRMNRATEGLDQWRERSAKLRAELRELASHLTPEWAARLPLLEPMVGSGAFLVGFPRSGTTLLDTFLLGHAQIEVIEERGLLVAAADIVGSLAQLPDCPAQTIHQARQMYCRRLASEKGGASGSLIVDKAPLNMLLVPLLHVLFPGVPIIFAQRHPCDAVLSGFVQSFTPNLGMANFLDIEDAADFYDTAMQVWTKSADVLELRIHTVVYEELVADPEQALRPAIEFLGLKWDANVLDHVTTAKSRGPVHNPSQHQIVEPLNLRAAGRWRRYEKQLAPTLPVLLPWAERLGYRA
jgi:Flp pilus assembly protein TadD